MGLFRLQVAGDPGSSKSGGLDRSRRAFTGGWRSCKLASRVRVQVRRCRGASLRKLQVEGTRKDEGGQTLLAAIGSVGRTTGPTPAEPNAALWEIS